MSGIKIQINSLEALERLIGGETQLEIDLRGAIVQEFAKKYLKNVADEYIMDKAKKEAYAYIQDNFFKTTGYFSKTQVMNSSFKEEIEKVVKSEFSILVNKLIRDYMESDETIVMIKKRIDDKVIATAARIEEELADTILSKRIDDLVTKKLKERLGI